jgi:hypothetical protein
MNAARELHSLYDAWATIPTGHSIWNVRVASVPGKPESQQDPINLVRAARLLGEVQQALDELERAGEPVDFFRSFVPEWVDALYLPAYAWQSGVSSSTQVIPSNTLSTLGAFATYLDKTTLRPRAADAASFASARQASEQILTVLRDQDDLEDDERLYVFKLLDSIRSLLDAKDLRVNAQLIARVNELRGWLLDYEEWLESQQPGNPVVKLLRRAARQLLPPAAKAFAVGSGALGVVSDIGALTAGS